MNQKLTLRLNPKDWHYLGRWVQPVFPTLFWLYWGKTKNVRSLGLRLKSNVVGADGHFYMWKNDYDNVFRTSKRAAKGKGKFFDKLIKESVILKKRLLKVESQYLGKKVSATKSYYDFFETMQEMVGVWQAIFPIADGAEAAFNEIMEKKGLNPNDFSEIFKPKRESWLTEQSRQAEKIWETIRENGLERVLMMSASDARRALQKKAPGLLRKMDRHVEYFKWFGTHHFWGYPFSFEKLLQQIKETGQKPKIVKKVPPRLPREAVWLAKELDRLIFWRLHYAEITDRFIFSFWPLFKNFSRANSLPWDYYIWMTSEEFEEMILKNKMISLKILKEREKSYAWILKDNKEYFFTGQKVKEVLGQLGYFKKVAAQTEIKGVPGCPGSARGKVRVVTSPKATLKFKTGEILVVPETTPDFVPLMKKAAAIVTDQGGITSHAAIVSRELNKPCVIGTKIATKVLHDGDLVEVDAEKGVVKKIK